MLKYAINDAREVTPERIDKALYFIDGLRSINKAVSRFRQQLVQMTKDIQDPTKKYTITRASGSYNVYKIVSFYTTYVAVADQNSRYAKFKSILSIIRILQGILAVATSTNFLDVKQVIQLKNAITKDIDDIIQRLRRTSRTLLEQAYIVLYLPQYIDDRMRYVLKDLKYQSIIPPLGNELGYELVEYRRV